MNTITTDFLEKFWPQNTSLWMTPPQLSASEKKLLRQAQKRLQSYKGIIWFSSSGSTSDGGLKFFAHTRKTLEAASMGSNRHLKATKRDHVLNLLPLFHVGGFSTWLRARLGRYLWTDHSQVKWDAVKATDFMNKNQVTLTSMVPTQIHDLVEAKLQSPKCLRAVIVGGGRLSEELYVKALSLGWPLLPSYGLTELGSQVATASLTSLKENVPPKLRWLPHIKGFSQDSHGRWWVKSPSSCLYQMRITPEGVFSLEQKTRSQGLLLDDDLIVNEHLKTVEVFGRRSRVVKILGELVSLDAVQRELQKDHQAHLGDFVVISSPHPRQENELVVMIEGEDFFSWETLIRRYNETAPGFKRIARFEFVPEFPRTALGKIKTTFIKSIF